MQYRYLCQFRTVGTDYFTTDCAFYQDQLHRAMNYVHRVVSQVETVQQGFVWDTVTRQTLYTASKSRTVAEIKGEL